MRQKITSQNILFLFHSRNPNPLGRDDQSIIAVNWEPIDSSTIKEMPYLDITSKLEVKKQPEQERMEFWDDLYGQYNGDFM